MTPHSSTLAWKFPWTEEPGEPQSMGSLRVGHNWATSLSLFTFMHWSKKWQPTPVFLPRESQGWGSLVGCHLWGRTELDTQLKWLSSSSNSKVVLVGQTRLPMLETWETWVLSLGQEDPLEKGMATHYNILAWRIPWAEEPDRLQSLVS